MRSIPLLCLHIKYSMWLYSHICHSDMRLAFIFSFIFTPQNVILFLTLSTNTAFSAGIWLCTRSCQILLCLMQTTKKVHRLRSSLRAGRFWQPHPNYCLHSGECRTVKQPLNASSALVIWDNGFDISMPDRLQDTASRPLKKQGKTKTNVGTVWCCWICDLLCLFFSQRRNGDNQNWCTVHVLF